MIILQTGNKFQLLLVFMLFFFLTEVTKVLCSFFQQ